MARSCSCCVSCCLKGSMLDCSACRPERVLSSSSARCFIAAASLAATSKAATLCIAEETSDRAPSACRSAASLANCKSLTDFFSRSNSALSLGSSAGGGGGAGAAAFWAISRCSFSTCSRSFWASVCAAASPFLAASVALATSACIDLTCLSASACTFLICSSAAPLFWASAFTLSMFPWSSCACFSAAWALAIAASRSACNALAAASNSAIFFSVASSAAPPPPAAGGEASPPGAGASAAAGAGVLGARISSSTMPSPGARSGARTGRSKVNVDPRSSPGQSTFIFPPTLFKMSRTMRRPIPSP
mmetsp:Transcript_13567/g.30786  ORF Transcript_13567/g.30786 Transcript_13567/m.30786 type:complete len:305 (+) Transcript_13567:777-1691(+)